MGRLWQAIARAYIDTLDPKPDPARDEELRRMAAGETPDGDTQDGGR